MADSSQLGGDLLDKTKEPDGASTPGPESSIDIIKEDKSPYESATDDQENGPPNNSPGSPDFKRPFGNVRWALVVFGLLLGAFLYGVF
jgi:hypothetical protein